MEFRRVLFRSRWWHSSDPVRTAFFNALSSTFPVGEKFFMTSVRHYREGTPQPLRGQIDDFLYQESMHSREHVVFNRQAEDAGFDIASTEDRARRTIDRKSVVEGKSVSVRVDLGGRRVIKKKT